MRFLKSPILPILATALFVTACSDSIEAPEDTSAKLVGVWAGPDTTEKPATPAINELPAIPAMTVIGTLSVDLRSDKSFQITEVITKIISDLDGDSKSEEIEGTPLLTALSLYGISTVDTLLTGNWDAKGSTFSYSYKINGFPMNSATTYTLSDNVLTTEIKELKKTYVLTKQSK